MVMKSQILRSADFLVDFLSETNTEQFRLKALGKKIAKGPMTIQEFQTLNGEIEVEAKKDARVFCENLDTYVKTFTEINNQ